MREKVNGKKRKMGEKKEEDYCGLDSCWKVKSIPHTDSMIVGSSCVSLLLLCGLCCTCVDSVAYPVCLCKPALVPEVVCYSSAAGRPWMMWLISMHFSHRLFSEPGALMLQHADVGKCPAAPVVEPVTLALVLQSPSAAACWWHAAAGAGAARALVFKDADF